MGPTSERTMFLPKPEPSEAADRVYRSTVDAQGFVMKLTRLWAWRPDTCEAFAALRSLLKSKSALSKRDQAVIACATASQLRDAYCSLAWGKTLATEAGPEAAAAVLADPDCGAATERDRVLARWARLVVADPGATTSVDVDALRAAGFGDREIFEATPSSPCGSRSRASTLRSAPRPTRNSRTPRSKRSAARSTTAAPGRDAEPSAGHLRVNATAAFIPDSGSINAISGSSSR
jgi:uncharacterized peroxidase-related enzyme